MKPTELQINIAKVVEEQANFWQNTNNINSPTHLCDIEKSITRDLLHDLDKDTRYKLYRKIEDLYHFIKNIN